MNRTRCCQTDSTSPSRSSRRVRVLNNFTPILPFVREAVSPFFDRPTERLARNSSSNPMEFVLARHYFLGNDTRPVDQNEIAADGGFRETRGGISKVLTMQSRLSSAECLNPLVTKHSIALRVCPPFIGPASVFSRLFEDRGVDALVRKRPWAGAGLEAEPGMTVVCGLSGLGRFAFEQAFDGVVKGIAVGRGGLRVRVRLPQ
jgi:hypothetical protein